MADTVKMRSALLPGPLLEDPRPPAAVAHSYHMVSLLKICSARCEGPRSSVAMPVSLLIQIPPWVPLVGPEEVIGFD